MLADAWHAGTLLTELPVAIRPRTMAEGYDVRDRFVAALGEPVAGWKLGVGSAAQKCQSGVGRSIASRILGSHLFRRGDTIRLLNAAPVTIEVAYILGRDVQPDEAEFPVLEAVAELRTAFELVLSRFTDRRAVGWPSFAGDNGAFHALVPGEAIEPARVSEMARTLVLTVDGKEAARSLSGQDATDPEAALGDLVATARAGG
jgi:2-keto-4-pentenoate hydratase